VVEDVDWMDRFYAWCGFRTEDRRALRAGVVSPSRVAARYGTSWQELVNLYVEQITAAIEQAVGLKAAGLTVTWRAGTVHCDASDRGGRANGSPARERGRCDVSDGRVGGRLYLNDRNSSFTLWG